MPKPRNVTPPKSEKRNQHYVPQNWSNRFRGSDGHVYCLRNGEVTQVAISKIMSDDWIYTIFDEWWRPSDALEDKLATLEGQAKILFDDLHATTSVPSEKQWVALIAFLALTACRHPETMKRLTKRARELAWPYAFAEYQGDEQAFRDQVKRDFGIDVPRGVYQSLVSAGPEALLEQLELLEGLSPQDPRLPEQLSLTATGLVASTVAVMHMRILDAPSGSTFVLGDCPVPLSGLSNGFDVPLSGSLAFQAWPCAENERRILERRVASQAEVDATNLRQAQRTRTVVIGPDKAVLEALNNVLAAAT